MPGTAHGRASVPGLREYGRNLSSAGTSSAVAKRVRTRGSEATSGTCHGSEPLAR